MSLKTSQEMSRKTAPPPAWRNATRRALLVGIGRYACSRLHDLGGCRNDAVRLAALLRNPFDFGTVCLLDSAATRDALIAHLKMLLEVSGEGDEAVLAFSGHGSRILSDDHGAFETLVLHDSHRPDEDGERSGPNRDFTDRELYGWILAVSRRGARVTLLIDACRAGGIVRDLEVRPRGVEPDLRRGVLEDKVAFLATPGNPSHDLPPGAGPSATGSAASWAAPLASNRRLHTPAPRDPATAPRPAFEDRGWLPPSDSYTLLAACRAEEYCREMIDPESGQHHGILTLHLARGLQRLRGATSWRELADAIGRHIQRENPGQHLQVEGALDREVFGGRWLRPEPFAPVLRHDGDEVILERGSAHGVGLGSRWRIHPRDARRPEGEALATVRVAAVGAVRSRALVEPRGDSRESPPELVGCRAFEVERSLGPNLRVLVADRSEAGRRLEGDLGASPLLEPADEAAAADLVIHRLGPRTAKVAEGEPAPGLLDLPSPHWVFAHRDGGQALPAHPAPDGDLRALDSTVEHTVRNLERLARHRFLHALSHPEPASSLARAIDLTVHRKRPKGPWSQLEPGGAAAVGNRLALRLERRAKVPERLYVAALDLGLTGAVTLLYPRRAQRIAWENHRLDIGRRTDDRMFVKLPEGYPFKGEPPFQCGVETVLLFITTRWTDFDGLTQGAVGPRRSGGDSPLAAILDRGLGRTVRSGSRNNLLGGPEHWGLIPFTFKVVP